MKLVLWDIDGTLVDSAKLGRDAFFEAFEEVVGHPVETVVPFAGRTDLEIAHDLLAVAGVEPDEGLLDRFGDALAAAMASRSDELRAKGRPFPGVRQALERLDAEPDLHQSLLTGNIEPNARVKLAAFDLDRYLDFEIGAYGSDHRMRGELVAIAIAKARRLRGLALEPSDVVLVGDTPLDVKAAREGGAQAIAVATGPYGEEDLAATGADSVLPDVSDIDRLLAAILG